MPALEIPQGKHEQVLRIMLNAQLLLLSMDGAKITQEGETWTFKGPDSRRHSLRC